VSQKVLFVDDAPAVREPEPEPVSRALPPRGAVLMLLLVGAIALLRLGAVPLIGPDEPRYARVAVEMQRAGAWVSPTLQGEPWLEKPPLYYWLAGTAFRFLGETETAARLPSVLALLLLTGATALVAARLYGAGAGLHAGFALGTSLLSFAYGRAASMDMLLAACATAATGLVALRLLGIAGRAALPAAGVFVGLALLAKGPLGLLLPGLVTCGFLLIARDRTAWDRLVRPLWMPSLAAALCGLVALPWYLAAWRAHGREFVDVFLLNHNLQRFTSTIHRHPGPIVYYVPVLLLGLFPWAGLVPAALRAVAPRRSRADLFVLLWLALPFAFFSLAGSKLPGYILPCLAPLAILVGRVADRWTRGSPGAWGRAAALLGLVLGAVVFASAFALRAQGEPRWQLLVPLGAWSLIVAFLFSRTIGRDPSRALHLLRVGAAGTLLLVIQAAPPLLAARESGRGLFLPANRQDVIAWGAWRTAWMAGYFYNDGRVRQVEDFASVSRAVEAAPTLVLAGPAERKRLEAIPSYRVTMLAQGPRANALLHVARR
jgi:4-amino-4-deoxy-L-arabinose transferase-like glycosyltransferase